MSPQEQDSLPSRRGAGVEGDEATDRKPEVPASSNDSTAAHDGSSGEADASTQGSATGGQRSTRPGKAAKSSGARRSGHLVDSKSPAPKPAPRDSSAAKKQIADSLRRAQQQVDAVDRFHAASDRMDEARAVIEASTAERNTALADMRDAGMTISTMSQVTYLSTSYIRTCLQKRA